MVDIPLEYVICQIQSGQFSMACKARRIDGQNPVLTIDVNQNGVSWKINNIDYGDTHTVMGKPRVNRVDVYFLYQGFRETILPIFPSAIEPPSNGVRLNPLDSRGRERRTGKRVMIETPICRFHPIEQVTIISKSGAYVATASDATLHLDFETGPQSDYGPYPRNLEIHLGIEANYTIDSVGQPSHSEVEFFMSHGMYAAIIAELLCQV